MWRKARSGSRERGASQIVRIVKNSARSIEKRHQTRSMPNICPLCRLMRLDCRHFDGWDAFRLSGLGVRFGQECCREFSVLLARGSLTRITLGFCSRFKYLITLAPYSVSSLPLIRRSTARKQIIMTKRSKRCVAIAYHRGQPPLPLPAAATKRLMPAAFP